MAGRKARKKPADLRTTRTSGGHPKTTARRYEFTDIDGLALALDEAGTKLRARHRAVILRRLVHFALETMGVTVRAADAPAPPGVKGRPGGTRTKRAA